MSDCGIAKRTKRDAGFVSERRRIEHARRKLTDGEKLRVCRQDSRWRSDLGRYYIVDHHNMLVAWGIEDIDDLHHELTGDDSGL